MCPSCDNHNFASRQTCNMCGAAQSGGGGGYGAVRPSAQARPSPYSGGAKAESGGGGGSPMREGDWTCPDCNNHNFASRVVCNKCSRPKDGIQTNQELRPGDWMCRECGNHNFASRDACNKCRAPRPGKRMPAPPMMAHAPLMAAYGGNGYGAMPPQRGPPVKFPPNAKEGDWMCSSCGNHNFASRMECNKCRCPKMGRPGQMAYSRQPMAQASPAQAMPGNQPIREGDWMCPKCSNHNFAIRVQCNKCQSVRPGMKEGDWICKACKNHNFKSRENCNKCQEPRS